MLKWVKGNWQDGIVILIKIICTHTCEHNIDDLKGEAPWCYRIMKHNGFSMHTKTKIIKSVKKMLKNMKVKLFLLTDL